MPGSFEVDYGFYSADSPDYVTIEYMDETTWSWQTVSCIPTGSPALKEKRIQMVGPTKRRQAWAEGLYKAYANRDQRKTVKFTTDVGGLIPLYGDLVSVSHDLPKWGISGTVDGFDGERVHVSEVLEWTPKTQHYVYFRQRNGRPTDALRVLRPDDVSDDQEMILIDPVPAGFVFSDGYSEEPTMFSFGPARDRIAQDLRLINATPRDDQVELTFVNNADSPHTAELGLDPPPPVSPSLLPGVVHAPIIAQVSVNQKITPGSVTIVAAPAAGALLYDYQGSLDGGATWVPLGRSPSNTLSVAVALGQWELRVRAFGASGLPGPFAVWTGTVEEFVYPAGAPTLSLREPFTGNQLSIDIQRAAGVDFYEVQIVVGGVIRYSADMASQNFTWTLDQARVYEAVDPTFDVRVAAGNIEGLGPASSLTVTSTPPPAPYVTASATDSTVTLGMSVPGYPGIAGFRVLTPDGAVAYDGAAGTFTVAADGQAYSVFAYNAWQSLSAPTLVLASAAQDGGGGGGGGGNNH